MRNWNDYLQTNSESSMDCQLVTVCNANTYFNNEKINQFSKKYQKLLVECGCVAGSCIDTRKAFDQFNLEVDKTFKIYELDELLELNTFFEISIWHKFFGFHSVACVDYVKKCDALRITNLKHVTSLDGWIFKEDLKPHIVENPNREGWCFRTFKSNKHGD